METIDHPRKTYEAEVAKLRQEFDRSLGALEEHLRGEENPHLAEALRAFVDRERKNLQKLADLLVSFGKPSVGISAPEYNGPPAPDLWLYRWSEQKPHMLSLIHDYGDSHAVIHLFQGNIQETIYHPKGEMILREKTKEGRVLVSKISSAFNEGSTLAIPEHYIHSLAPVNPDKPLVTVHAYLPPLKALRIFAEERAEDGIVTLIHQGDQTVSGS